MPVDREIRKKERDREMPNGRMPNGRRRAGGCSPLRHATEKDEMKQRLK